MRRVLSCLLALIPFASGCPAPIEPPAEVVELSHFLFAEWENEDPAVMEAGIANLYDWMQTVDLDAGYGERSFAVAALDHDLVADFVIHEHDASTAPAVGLVHRSEFDGLTHAGITVQADQTPYEPSAPEKYDRTIFEGDGACFLDQSCPLIRTNNDVTKQNLILRVDHTLRKDWRWVDTENGPALCARSIMEDEFTGEAGNNTLMQAYAIDIHVPDADGGSIRWMVTWQETVVAGVEQSVIESTLGFGMQQIFDRHDQSLEDGL